MEHSPETLLSRPQSSYSSWPQLTQVHMYKSQYFVDITRSHTNNNTPPSQRRPLRVYGASTYDISAFLQALRHIQHRAVGINDMSTKVPPDSVPPYTQEILYLLNNFPMNNIDLPPVKLVPHRSRTVCGFSLALLTEDLGDQTTLQIHFPECSSKLSSEVIGLCSIFYLPSGSLSAAQYQTHETFYLYNARGPDLTSHNREFETILSEIYRCCREYQVRYCLLTDGRDTRVVELFQDEYMDHSPYDIILLSDNEDRSIPLTLGGLLWDVLSSICHDAQTRDGLSTE